MIVDFDSSWEEEASVRLIRFDMVEVGWLDWVDTLDWVDSFDRVDLSGYVPVFFETTILLYNSFLLLKN